MGDEEFKNYIEIFNLARKRINEATSSSEVYSNLANLIVTFSYLVEKKQVVPSEGDSKYFSESILSKLGHEMLGFISCHNNGSVYGMLHLLRSVIETSAAASYVARKPDKRFAKFNNFGDLRRYQSYLKLSVKEDLLEDEKIELQIAKKNMPSSQTIEKWKGLFFKKFSEENKVETVRCWHSPANIDNLISELHLPIRQKRFYDHYSQAVHLSPLAVKLIGNSIILQKEQLKFTEEIAFQFAYYVSSIAKEISPWLSTSLFNKLGSILEGFTPSLAQKLDEEEDE